MDRRKRKAFTQQFYYKNKIIFAAALATTLMMSGFNLIISWLIQQIMDSALGSDTGPLLRAAGWSVTATVFFVINYILYRKAQPEFLKRAMRKYKNYVFERLTAKSIRSFTKEGTALYISALTNDAASIETNYLLGTFNLIEQAVCFVGALIMMLCYNPLLTAAAIGMSMLPVAVSMAIGGRLAEQEKEISRKNEGFVSIVNELLSGFSVIKSFRAEKQTTLLFQSKNEETERAKCRKRRTEHLIQLLAGAAGIVAQLGIFLVGAWLAVTGQGVTAGVVIVFVQLMNYILNPISQVPLLLSNRKAALALIDKLAASLDENVREEGVCVPARLENGIEIRDLTYGYEPDQPVLNHISLKLEAGKSYAIVGGSGSGKSTLFNLLMGSSSQYEGEIRIDGMPLRKISSESLYELITLVQQNVFVFHDTIRNNVTMFHQFPDEEVTQALNRSGLSALIAQRGADFICGENGSSLSGGERQRISIARALLRGTPVMLIDEATAALDAATAHQVSSAILDLQGLTRVVVTHRLEESLLRRYDQILVMKAGQICEQGGFDELMEKKELFYSLFQIAQ